MTIRTYPLCYDLFDVTLARDDGEQFNAHNTGLEIETQRPKNLTPITNMLENLLWKYEKRSMWKRHYKTECIMKQDAQKNNSEKNLHVSSMGMPNYY